MQNATKYGQNRDPVTACGHEAGRFGRVGGHRHESPHDERLRLVFPKPTIAMVNGYCFGGAFTQVCACDFAIAADDAVFGVVEVNWGILPSGIVSWNVTQ